MSCTPREAKQRVTSAEYTEYVAFFKLFPWTYDTAFLATLISNLMRGKDAPPFSIADFMPADRPVVDPLAKTWQNFRTLAKDPRYGKH